MARYTPRRGDLVWLKFDPQAGHEQSGRRPALVVSHDAYNSKVGLALMCPITSNSKGYPFEVTLPKGMPIHGVVLADQVRNLDWHAREARFIGRVGQPTLQEVLARIHTLIDE